MGRNVNRQGTLRRKKQIVKAALECFRSGGIRKSSMQQICKQAGLSPGTVYHYFSSKDDIIAHVARIELEKAQEFAALITHAASLEEAMTTAVDHILHNNEYDGQFQVYMEIACEAGRNEQVGKLLLQSDKTVLEALTARIRREQMLGILKTGTNQAFSPETIAQFLGSQLEMLEMFKRSSPSTDDCTGMASLTKQMLTAILR